MNGWFWWGFSSCWCSYTNPMDEFWTEFLRPRLEGGQGGKLKGFQFWWVGKHFVNDGHGGFWHVIFLYIYILKNQNIYIYISLDVSHEIFVRQNDCWFNVMYYPSSVQSWNHWTAFGSCFNFIFQAADLLLRPPLHISNANVSHVSAAKKRRQLPFVRWVTSWEQCITSMSSPSKKPWMLFRMSRAPRGWDRSKDGWFSWRPWFVWTFWSNSW